MIHVFVGTKAQFIKMAPVMHELDGRGVPYNFIDAGQHAAFTGDLIRQFGLRGPDVFLREESTNIDNTMQAINWTAKTVLQVAFNREKCYQRVFRGEKGICLIHGDTLTTLISLLYAKRCGIKVAHIEAGLRSYHWRDPFPEEMIRRIAMRYSDILFSPSDWAFENLRKMGYADKAVKLGSNTIVDTLRYSLKHMNGRKRPPEPYVVATIHRVETIYSYSRLITLVDLLERIALDRIVLFVLHEPTRNRLVRFGLHRRILTNEAIITVPLQPYFTFIDLLAGADFVVTDGGSIQEESYFLNVPCLIMRSKTERQEGLGENAYLAMFERDRIQRFLGSISTFRRGNTDDDAHPSSVVVDNVLAWS